MVILGDSRLGGSGRSCYHCNEWKMKRKRQRKRNNKSLSPSTSIDESESCNSINAICITKMKAENRPVASILVRKSSCVNARGIPPATQQVFAVLICPGGTRGTYPGRWSTYPVVTPPSHLDLTRVGTSAPSGPGQGR